MKDKALQIMRENIEYYYDTKYSRGASYTDKETAREGMACVYDALRELGLLTRDEYRAMKKEIHDRIKEETA